jgi:hypothetical protein
MSETQSHGCTPQRKAATRQFGLASWMLSVLWLSAGLALARVALVLALLYCFATLPALVRTWSGVTRCKRAGISVSTRAMVYTFLRSLKMVGLLSAATVATMLGACAAVCLGVLVIAARCSRLAAGFLSKLLRPSERLTRWMVSVTRRLMATLRGCRPLIVPWRIAVLAASSISALVLLSVLAAVGVVRMCCRRFAAMEGLVLFLRDRFLLWTRVLLATDRTLLRAFQAAP